MADLTPRIDGLLGRLGAGTARAASGLPPELRLGDPGFAKMVARLVAMPIDQFARKGQLLEIRVPWHAETLWLASTEEDAEALGRQGVSRGRVWTARELIGVLATAGRTREALRTIALAKLTFNGDVAEIIPRETPATFGSTQQEAARGVTE